MIRLNNVIILSLFALIFGATSCMKKGENISSHLYIPAIVEYSFLQQPLLKTSLGTVLAPELSDDLLKPSELLVTNFSVNYDNQPSSEYTTISNVQYVKVESSYPAATPGGESTTEDYTVPIEDMLYRDPVVNILFFGFIHTAPGDQKFVYEMTYDSEDTSDTPTLYIRAKKDGEGTETKGAYLYFYAFDMTSYFSSHKTDATEIKFNIKYKTGVDDEGKDVYKSWTNNPFIWEVAK